MMSLLVDVVLLLVSQEVQTDRSELRVARHSIYVRARTVTKIRQQPEPVRNCQCEESKLTNVKRVELSINK